MNIKERRTIRKYTQQPVSDELLNRLIEEASRTQTMGNLQLYSVVVTRSAAMKEMLAPAHFCQPMVTQAPVLLTVCADFRRTTDWCLQRQATPGYDNFLSFINAATDALLFTQTFCCLAEEEGLGVCFLGTTVYQPQAIISALELPELVFPVATLTIGWPAEKPALTDRMGALLDARAEYLGSMFMAINRDYGGVEGFLRDICKLDAADLQQLRYLYLQ